MATASAELIEIASKHQLHYERLKSHEVKAFDNFLIQLDEDLRKQLSKTDITSFTRARLEKQLALVQEIIRGVYRDYKKVWRDDLLEIGIYEAEFEKKALDRVVINKEFVLPTEAAISAAVFSRPLAVEGINNGALLDRFFEQLPENTVKRVEGAIRLGFAQGQTTQQVMNRIRGTARAKYTDGLMALSRRDAELITRTALQHVSSQARFATWDRNRDIISGVKIIATLDDRTSFLCRTLDSKVFPIDKAPMPPFHIRCRTTTTSVLDSRFSILEEGATRSARDEEGKVISVDANETYYSWLKKQNFDFISSVIGKTRANLLINGGLSAERFAELNLNKDFTPASIKEMKKIEPLAFIKAGIN